MGNSCSPGCRGLCLLWRLFVLSFFPLDVLDEIWDVIESVSEEFLTYSHQRSASDFQLLIASLLLADVSIFSTHKRRVRMLIFGNRFGFFDFIPPKETFRREMR